jgi:hypothetical protein
VDKAAIIKKELAGLADPVDSLFPKNAPYCGVDLTPKWDYDFEMAQFLCGEDSVTKSLETDRGALTTQILDLSGRSLPSAPSGPETPPEEDGPPATGGEPSCPPGNPMDVVGDGARELGGPDSGAWAALGLAVLLH